MPRNPNQKHVQSGRFSLAGTEPLSRKNITMRLPVSAHDTLHELFPESVQRNDWLRQVLVQAIETESEARKQAEAS